MNCQEFRHQLLADPCRGDEPFRAHALVCPECARALDEALWFEQRLRTAMTAELLSTGAREPRWTESMRFLHRYALLSLSLLLAGLWLGFRAALGPDSDDDLASIVIAHIQTEDEYLQFTGRISGSSLRTLFRSLGADVDPTLGPVSFAGHCLIGEREGIHLVLPGERGAVTALFMPGIAAPKEREVSGGGFAGSILPAGAGSVAIVGESGEPLEPVTRRLLGAVRWN